MTKDRLSSVALAIALGSAFLIPLLAPITIDHKGRVFHAWWDFTHVPAFTLFAWGVLTLLRWRRANRKQLVGAWLLAIACVPGLEYLQGYVGRSQDPVDLMYGMVGCLIGALLFVCGIAPSAIRMWARALILALSLSVLLHPARLWWEDRRIDRMFPVLSAFDSPLEITRWHIVGCEVQLNRGFEITVRDDANCSALVLSDMIHDWSSAQGLGVDIFLHGNEPSEMSVIVDDSPFFPDYYNRFQKTVTLKPGTNSVIIERYLLGVTNGGRPMNMNNICGVGLYFNQKHAGQVLHLTKVDLVDEPT